MGTGPREIACDFYRCRVAPGDCSPGAPTDPDVRISRIRLVESRVRCAGTFHRAPVDEEAPSGVRAPFAKPAIRSSLVEMFAELGVSFIVPSNGSVIRCRLRSTGSLGSVPRLRHYYAALRLPALRRSSLPFVRYDLPATRRERAGSPRFLDNPCRRAAFSDPGDPLDLDRQADVHLARPVCSDVAFHDG